MFGAKKLPELARGLGQGIKEFKKATNEVTSDLQKALDDEPTPPPPAPRAVPEAKVAAQSAPEHDTSAATEDSSKA